MSRLSSPGPAEVLEVDLSGLAGAAWRIQATVLASLPELLRTSTGQGQNDVVVVDGKTPYWPGVVAQGLGEARRGIVVSAPTTVPTATVNDLAERADEAGCPVAVALPFQLDPDMWEERDRFQPGGTTLSLIDSVLTVAADGDARSARSALHAGLLAQVAAARSVTGSLSSLEFRHDTSGAYLVTGLAGSTAVMLSGVLSALPRHELRADLVGIGGRCTIRLREDPVATPALFDLYTASGMSRPRLSYTGGLRAAWRNLHAAVTAAEPVRYGLPELACDLAVLP